MGRRQNNRSVLGAAQLKKKMKLLRRPTIDKDGFALNQFNALKEKNFSAKAAEIYDGLKTGENSNNKLRRGIAWGIFAQNEFTWLDRNTYQLSKELNPEENGALRRFVPLPHSFLRDPAIQETLRQAFDLWNFDEPSQERAYEVQLSAIRYEPTLAQPALPSPLQPHQDLIDGTIVVVNREGNLVGGISRLYGLDGEPLYELNLEVGEGLSVRDEKLLHQVTVMALEPGQDWRSGDRAFRDVLLIRFQKLGR